MIFGKFKLWQYGSLTLTGDFDTVALKTAPQDALHGPIEGRARVYHAASMLIWAAFGISPTMDQELVLPPLPGPDTP